jgi:hypothetical protein
LSFLSSFFCIGYLLFFLFRLKSSTLLIISTILSSLQFVFFNHLYFIYLSMLYVKAGSTYSNQWAIHC